MSADIYVFMRACLKRAPLPGWRRASTDSSAVLFGEGRANCGEDERVFRFFFLPKPSSCRNLETIETVTTLGGERKENNAGRAMRELMLRN